MCLKECSKTNLEIKPDGSAVGTDKDSIREVDQLREEIAKLKEELRKAKAIIEIQKRISDLLNL